MNPQIKQELETFYGLAISASATTNFYNQVYAYVAFINKSQYLSHVLDEDDKEMHMYDLEKQRTLPKKQDGDSDFQHTLKELKHMSSGERYFVSHLFFLLNHHIFDLLDWYFTDNFQSEEASIMLNGRKRVTIKARFDRIVNYWNRHNILGYDSTDYNERYIDNLSYWKKLLTDFHTALLKKVETSPTKEHIEIKKDIVLTLASNGDVTYLGQNGNLTPQGREFNLLKRLIHKNGRTVSHKEIARLVYKKKDTEVLRLEMPDLVRKLKKKLFDISSQDTSNLVKNNYRLGYYLDLQENQEAKLLP